jgi:hypothetical protein
MDLCRCLPNNLLHVVRKIGSIFLSISQVSYIESYLIMHRNIAMCLGMENRASSCRIP